MLTATLALLAWAATGLAAWRWSCGLLGSLPFPAISVTCAGLIVVTGARP